MYASRAEPGRPLPGPFHDPLVFVLLARRLPFIQDDRLQRRRPQRAAFHCLYLLANQSRLLAHLGVTEGAQDVLLLQVATLRTRLNVVLREGEQGTVSKRLLWHQHYNRTKSLKIEVNQINQCSQAALKIRFFSEVMLLIYLMINGHDPDRLCSPPCWVYKCVTQKWWRH